MINDVYKKRLNFVSDGMKVKLQFKIVITNKIDRIFVLKCDIMSR